MLVPTLQLQPMLIQLVQDLQSVATLACKFLRPATGMDVQAKTARALSKLKPFERPLKGF